MNKNNIMLERGNQLVDASRLKITLKANSGAVSHQPTINEKSCNVRTGNFAEPHLDYSNQALISGGVCGDGEPARGVASSDLIHCVPGSRAGLVFVGDCQVGDNDVDSILRHFPVKLLE